MTYLSKAARLLRRHEGVRYCPYCGKEIEDVVTEADDE